MTINYVISPYPALLENMVAKVYESQAPTAEVASFTILEKDNTGTPTVGAGHQVPNNISFSGLDFIPHILRLFTAGGTKLHEYDVLPTVDTVTVFDPVCFVVGDGGTYTPASGSSVIINPMFSGLSENEVMISKEGFRSLLPVTEYTNSGDSISLLGGITMATGEGWYILLLPKVITTPVNDSVVGKGFGGFVTISTNTDYTASHLRKLIRLSGTGDYTFPVAANIPIGYLHQFNNFGTNPSTPKINFSNGTLLYDGSPKSFIDMPFGSTACFTWDGANWNCIQYYTAIATPAVEIVAKGSYYFGDLAVGDNLTTITHGLALGYSYRVLGSLRSTIPTWAASNNCWWTYLNVLPNSFQVSVQEALGSGTQDITFDYIIVKA